MAFFQRAVTPRIRPRFTSFRRICMVRRHEVTRGRVRGTTARWKKAIVTLKEGESLPIFEG